MRYIIALLFLTSIYQIKAQEEIPFEQPALPKDPQELERGLDILHPVPKRELPVSPLSISHNSILQALFGYFPLDQAKTITDGLWEIKLRHDLSFGKVDEITPDYFFHYDAMLLENNFEFRWGVEKGWEIWAMLDISELFEQKGDIILARQGKLLIREGERRMGPGDFAFGFKKELFYGEWGGLLSFKTGAKIPLTSRKDDLLTSKGIDTSFMLLYTQQIGQFFFHLNVGVLSPGEPAVFEGRVKVRSPFYGGLSIVAKFSDDIVGALQFQGGQSVFTSSRESVEILTDTFGIVVAGIRIRLESYTLELSAGSGINDYSAKTVVILGVIIKI